MFSFDPNQNRCKTLALNWTLSKTYVKPKLFRETIRKTHVKPMLCHWTLSKTILKPYLFRCTRKNNGTAGRQQSEIAAKKNDSDDTGTPRQNCTLATGHFPTHLRPPARPLARTNEARGVPGVPAHFVYKAMCLR